MIEELVPYCAKGGAAVSMLGVLCTARTHVCSMYEYYTAQCCTCVYAVCTTYGMLP